MLRKGARTERDEWTKVWKEETKEDSGIQGFDV
jgi:hypothetical protein